MGFSRAQQPEFRTLVKQAWMTHCAAEEIDFKDKAGERAGYEAELFFATGNHSTVECNAGRDYDRAMAHFETLAGAGITWQMKVHSGDAKRILFQIGQVSVDHGLDEDYLRAVAARMSGRADRPELSTLPREDLIVILGEVKRFVRRNKRRRELAVEEPF